MGLMRAAREVLTFGLVSSGSPRCYKDPITFNGDLAFPAPSSTLQCGGSAALPHRRWQARFPRHSESRVDRR